MADKEEIKVQIKNIIFEAGAELIDFKLFFSSGKCTLRCLVDYPAGGITLKHCAEINKKIVLYLEASGSLGGNFVIEVNSPGLDRALKTRNDFLKVKGRVIFLWLNEPVADEQYLEAEIIDVNDDKLLLNYKGETLKINFDRIKLGKERIKV